MAANGSVRLAPEMVEVLRAVQAEIEPLEQGSAARAVALELLHVAVKAAVKDRAVRDR